MAAYLFGCSLYLTIGENSFTLDKNLSPVSSSASCSPTGDETFDAGTVVRKDALKNYPKLQEVLEKLNGLITEAEMQQMNYEVEAEGKEDKEVARKFLEAKGLL